MLLIGAILAATWKFDNVASMLKLPAKNGELLVVYACNLEQQL